MEPPDAFTYTYNLFANNTHLQVFILVEGEPDRPNHYTFSLSVKVGHVERALSAPVTMKLFVDPHRLDFIVFVFPPRSSLPTGCLYHLRVWLRTTGVDHRIFAEKDVWFGKDPDFFAIADAAFAYPRNATEDMSIYQGFVGRAHVSFIFRWTFVEPGTYALSLDYEAGGAGRTLFENYHLRLYCEPQSVSFVIYSIPVSSTPAGASHRLRVWLGTPHVVAAQSQSQLQYQNQNQYQFQSQSQPTPLSTESSGASGSFYSSAITTSVATTGSYLYQRLWKLDDFKIGALLDFEAAGGKFLLATPGRHGPSDSPPTFESTPTLLRRWRTSRLAPAPKVALDDVGEVVDDH